MKIWRALPVFMLAAIPVAARAEVKINGFLNVVGGYATERRHGEYPAEVAVFEPGSSLGLQVSSDISDRSSITGQLISRGSDNFQVEAAWAYLKYRVAEGSAFRAGRFRAPFYLFSDYLDVGYAQHWVTPPREVYALQFDSVNGFDFTQQIPLGPLDTKVQIYAGSANDNFVKEATGEELKLELREQMGIVGTVNYQWLTLRASFHQVTNLTIVNFADISMPAPLGSIGGLQDALRAFDQEVGLGASGRHILDNLDVSGTAAEFSEAAIRLEWPHLFIVAEGTLLTFSDGPLAEQRRHFVSSGARAGDITVYASYARADDNEVDLARGLPVTDPVSAALGNALRRLSHSLMVLSETTSVGLRYDFEPGAAFKLELSQNQMPQAADSHMLRLAYNLTF